MPGFMPYSAAEKENVRGKKKGNFKKNDKVNRFEKKGKKSFADVYGKGKK